MSRTKQILMTAAVLAACAPDSGPGTPFEPSLSAELTTSPRVYVLNTQLRGIIDPDIAPSAAYGHLQVKLTDNGDDTFSVEWKGRIFNPGGEAFASGVVGIIVPLPQPPFLTLFRFASSDAVSCGVIDFDSDGIIDPEILPAAIANSWITNPDIHEARFSTVDRPDGAIVGNFGVADPTTVLGFNPQPDPPRERARCAI